MRSSSLKVYSPVEYTGYKEKRSGHPSEPGSRTGNRKTTRKPKPILYRLRRFCKRRPEPTQEALEAVQDVFDFGIVATTEPIKYFYAPALVDSEWHESQIYVMTINGHRFFKEATE